MTKGELALSRINHYELPDVPCMVAPDHTEGAWYAETLLQQLRAQADTGDLASLWALETIAALQQDFADTADRLQDIEQIIRKHRDA